jgi:hypothetical protein
MINHQIVVKKIIKINIVIYAKDKYKKFSRNLILYYQTGQGIKNISIKFNPKYIIVSNSINFSIY